MNPIDEYFMAKTADWKDALQHGAISVGAGLALAGAPVIASHLYNSAMKNSRYNAMLENSSDDVRQFHEQNPKKAKMMFDSLHRMSPEFAADPLVASAYMHQMVGNPEGAGKHVVEARRESMKQPDQGVLSRAMQSMAPSVGKDLASNALKPSDPYSGLAQTVHGLELEKKLDELAPQWQKHSP
jgi:hypothetical protein